MGPNLFYRLSIWLPLALSFMVIIIMNVALAFGYKKPTGSVLVTALEFVGYFGVYGGLPYAVLAGFLTWWVKRTPEQAIRRMFLLGPAAAVALFAGATEIVSSFGETGDRWDGVILRFALVVLPLGYFYVGLVFVLRRFLSPSAGT